jgi:hypothetical protein
MTYIDEYFDPGHFYIYYSDGRTISYERTCGTKYSAVLRVKELLERNKTNPYYNAWWIRGVTIENAFV